MNNKISGIVIAKNEERVIADCLESLSFCDEIILVDSGSSDRTMEIAEKMGAKIIKVHLPDLDFSKLRNLGLQKAKYSWIIYLDADERVTKELLESIKYQVLSKEKSNEFYAYKIKRENFYLGNHEWPYVERLERLFKTNALKGWHGKLHESPIIEGEIGELNGFLLHYTHRTLSDMLRKTIEWSEIEAELRLEANHPKITWRHFPKVMLTAFFNSYIRQGGWKIGTAGLIESIYQAFSAFITYAKLWELQQKMQNENHKNN